MTNVILVNENNEVIGSCPFFEAIKNNHIRRTVRIIILNKCKKIYLQRRNKTAPLFPNVWDSSASGHVDEGETYEQAAYRETLEEIGIKTKLKFIETYLLEEKSNNYNLKSFDSIYMGHYDGKFILDPSEVSDGDWFSKELLNKLIKENPNKFTPGLKNALKKIDKLN